MWCYQHTSRRSLSIKFFLSLQKYILVFAAGLSLSSVAFAADIEVLPAKNKDDHVLITIEGEIKSGDDATFRSIAAKYSDAIVLLNSEGGMIGPAMDIGRTIKLLGYETVIYKTGSCVSACALIWVAGSKRTIFEGGEVGFHASYLDKDGAKLETGVGNALVGYYLSQLGLGEKSVVFATLAPPDKILWLNKGNTLKSGIDFELIPVDQKKEIPKVAENRPVKPSTTRQRDGSATVGDQARSTQFMGDAKQTLRKPEAFAKALRDKGYQAKVSYDDPKLPQILTGVGGEEILVSFSSCDTDGCSYIQLIDILNEITQREANLVVKLASSDEQYSHAIMGKDQKSLAFYNYIVIGSDGITAQTLIENMAYFVKDNAVFAKIIADERAKK